MKKITFTFPDQWLEEHTSPEAIEKCFEKSNDRSDIMRAFVLNLALTAFKGSHCDNVEINVADKTGEDVEKALVMALPHVLALALDKIRIDAKESEHKAQQEKDSIGFYTGIGSATDQNQGFNFSTDI